MLIERSIADDLLYKYQAVMMYLNGDCFQMALWSLQPFDLKFITALMKLMMQCQVLLVAIL